MTAADVHELTTALDEVHVARVDRERARVRHSTLDRVVQVAHQLRGEQHLPYNYRNLPDERQTF